MNSSSLEIVRGGCRSLHSGLKLLRDDLIANARLLIILTVLPLAVEYKLYYSVNDVCSSQSE